MRNVEVLVDRDAVASGAAAAGEPWRHYDLGHGYCTYTFFEQCPHRMACAKCDFCAPKSPCRADTAPDRRPGRRDAASGGQPDRVISRMYQEAGYR
jgi:hypothetical protein